jgi:CTP synthase (UTP-ammonia lyase)
VISKLVCSLAGVTETVRLLPGSRAAQAYGAEQASEQFACNYGLNPIYQEQMFQGDRGLPGRLPSQGILQATGFGPAGEVRVVELSQANGHTAPPFFLASLFLPQATSTPQQPHPLILAFLRAVLQPRV